MKGQLPLQRRDFIRTACAGAGALLWRPSSASFARAASPAVSPDPAVKRALAVFKCHLDVGFTDTQTSVIHRYFDQYFPQAIRRASELRHSGDRRYVWATGSWLLYEYLEQAGREDRKRMEQAIIDGDIAWHALPFSWQTELLDRSMIAGSLALSALLDRRFGKKTTGAKMTDVPGHTRGLINPLAANGVTFLDIGVNSASRVAEVPPLFLWKDRGGASLIVMYHHGYGTTMPVPGSGLAVAVLVGNDNSGPHNPNEIAKIYSDLKQQFPGAEITPTSLTEIANAVRPRRERQPVVTEEIGDTWVYGIASDPVKIARCREVMRLRRDWLARKRFQVGDATDVALLRRLLLEAEHTRGTDTKRWLDYDHYKPRDLADVVTTTKYKILEFSWEEKRQDLPESIKTLPAALRDQALSAIEKLKPVEPTSPGRLHSAGEDIETAHFIVALDDAGSIRRLRNKTTGREWASPDQRLALFSYQTLSRHDYSRFFSNYISSSADWVPKDFGNRTWRSSGPSAGYGNRRCRRRSVEENAEQHGILAALNVRDLEALESGGAAPPERMFLELLLFKSEPLIELDFYWFAKAPTQLPEGLWLTFRPVVVSEEAWTIDKCGEEISPFDVATSGSRRMHSVERGFRYREQQDEFSVELRDAPLIALGGDVAAGLFAFAAGPLGRHSLQPP